MKIAAILGTCPEAIKLAPIIRELRSDPQMECHVCVTNQRQQEVDKVLDDFEIIPDSSLDLSAPGLSLSGLTSVGMTMLDAFLRRETPHVVILEGASTVTLVAALAAFYRNIPIMHIEAGLRTSEMSSPWPEEENRVLITRLAELHFAPTPGSRRNLLAERVSPESIIVTGSTLIDSLYYAVARARQLSHASPGVPMQVAEAASGKPLVLISGHGHDGFDDRLESLCCCIAKLADELPQAQLVYSAQLGTNARDLAQRVLAGRNNIHLIPRLPYFSFVAAMDLASLILTDSRSVQREAHALNKPVLAFPEESPLTSNEGERIIAECSRLLSDQWYRASRSKFKQNAEEGHAAGRIVRAIQSRYASSQSWEIPVDRMTVSKSGFAS